MEGWHPDGYSGNLAYSPELWDWMFDLGFHLTCDHSQLTWLGIDPLDTLRHARQKFTRSGLSVTYLPGVARPLSRG